MLPIWVAGVEDTGDVTSATAFESDAHTVSKSRSLSQTAGEQMEPGDM